MSIPVSHMNLTQVVAFSTCSRLPRHSMAIWPHLALRSFDVPQLRSMIDFLCALLPATPGLQPWFRGVYMGAPAIGRRLLEAVTAANSNAVPAGPTWAVAVTVVLSSSFTWNIARLCTTASVLYSYPRDIAKAHGKPSGRWAPLRDKGQLIELDGHAAAKEGCRQEDKSGQQETSWGVRSARTYVVLGSQQNFYDILKVNPWLDDLIEHQYITGSP